MDARGRHRPTVARRREAVGSAAVAAARGSPPWRSASAPASAASPACSPAACAATTEKIASATTSASGRNATSSTDAWPAPRREPVRHGGARRARPTPGRPRRGCGRRAARRGAAVARAWRRSAGRKWAVAATRPRLTAGRTWGMRRETRTSPVAQRGRAGRAPGPGQVGARGAGGVGPDGVRPRGGARGDAGLPGGVAGDDELVADGEDERDEREQGDELDRRLAGWRAEEGDELGTLRSLAGRGARIYARVLRKCAECVPEVSTCGRRARRSRSPSRRRRSSRARRARRGRRRPTCGCVATSANAISANAPYSRPRWRSSRPKSVSRRSM